MNKNRPKEDFPLLKDKLIYMANAIDKLIKKDRYKINIVDLGCGFGHLSIPLLELGYRVVCVDRNKKLLGMLKNKLKKNSNLTKRVRIINTSIETFRSRKKFDVAICTEVLEHVDKPDEIMKTIKMLIKKEGIAIISIPNGFGTYEIFFDWPLILARKILKIKTDKGFYHVNFFTYERINKLIENNHLMVQNFKKGNFFPIIPIKNKIMEKIDIKIAKYCPLFLVNDWMFVVKNNFYDKK